MVCILCCGLGLWTILTRICVRLLEYAGTYYDLGGGFPEGETKRALKAVLAKRKGKAPDTAAEQTHRRKKQRV